MSDAQIQGNRQYCKMTSETTGPDIGGHDDFLAMLAGVHWQKGENGVRVRGFSPTANVSQLIRPQTCLT